MKYLTTYKLFEFFNDESGFSFAGREEIIDILQDIVDSHFRVYSYNHTTWIKYQSAYGGIEFESPITIAIDRVPGYEVELSWVDIRDSILHLKNWAYDNGYKDMYIFNQKRDSNKYITTEGLDEIMPKNITGLTIVLAR